MLEGITTVVLLSLDELDAPEEFVALVAFAGKTIASSAKSLWL